MKNSRNYKSQLTTQTDYCSLFNCYLNLTYKINEKTKEKFFDLPILLMDFAKLVWAEHTEGPGRQEVG